jgi:hypothetical protein
VAAGESRFAGLARSGPGAGGHSEIGSDTSVARDRIAGRLAGFAALAGRPAGTRHLHPRSSSTEHIHHSEPGKGAFSNAIPLRRPVMTYCISAILVV